MKSVLVLIVCCYCSVYAPAQTLLKYNQLIDSFRKTGQEDNLIPWFLKEVKARPGNENALKALGSLYFEKNDLVAGEKYYRQALKINQLCARCYMSLGIACAIRKDNKKALENLNKAVACDPGDAYIYSVRANLNDLMGYKQEALFDFNMAVYIDSKNALYYMQRGSFNGKAGYFYLALSDLNMAAGLAPANYLVFYTRADLYFGKKMFKEAIDDISKAISLDSTHAFLYSARGNFYSEINEFGKAVADYTHATSLDPGDFHLIYNRALCNYALEDMDAYCSDIHSCYTVLMQYAPADTMNARLEATMAVYCDPAKESYYYHRGIALFNQRRYTEALVVYSEAIKRFPASPLIWSFRGNTYLVLKDYAHAIADYCESITNKDNIRTDLKETNINTLTPDVYITGLFATTQLSMAQCEFSLGHYTDALAHISKGIEMAPVMKEFGKENYYNLRGIILITMGRQAEAVADFDTCLELNPAFESAWINRAVAKVNSGNGSEITDYKLKTDESLAIRVNWALPDRKKKKGDENILSAIEDCNRAILLNPKDEYAYYVRGRLGRITGYGNYCSDLVKARELGFGVEPKYMTDCGN